MADRDEARPGGAAKHANLRGGLRQDRGPRMSTSTSCLMTALAVLSIAACRGGGDGEGSEGGMGAVGGEPGPGGEGGGKGEGATAGTAVDGGAAGNAMGGAGASAGTGGAAGSTGGQGVLVTLDSGMVSGRPEGDINVFRGIPYAKPPVGNLRFRPPEAALPWQGVLDAAAFGARCPQRERLSSGPIIGDEDCLTLNVFAPAAGAANLPVMVFIHGGAYVQGSASEPVYDGASFAREGVVLVTINYRLGTLGFLATEGLQNESSAGRVGNYGLLDQIEALSWVKHNIRSFGGDPEAVTVFGESAGGGSICALLGMPLTETLFARAIIQSGGGCYGWKESQSAKVLGAEIARAAGCMDPNDASCLRALPVEDVVGAAFAPDAGGLGTPQIGPVIDGSLLPRDTWTAFSTGQVKDKPIITGSNANEAELFLVGQTVLLWDGFEARVKALFPDVGDQIIPLYPRSVFTSPNDAYRAFYGDVSFVCPSVSFAGIAASGDAPSYAYYLSHQLEGYEDRGTWHGDDLYYLFGALDRGILPVGVMDYQPNARDAGVSAGMRTAWVEFAKASLTNWPAYSPSMTTFRSFDGNPARPPLRSKIRSGRCSELARLGVVRDPPF